MLVTCNGCFDGLHAGHLFYLGYCFAQGSELVVGINTDDYIKRAKNREPIPQEERKQALENLECVSKVILFESDPVEFIKIVKPDVHCCGEEYKESGCKEADFCRDNGIKIVWVPRVGSWSSTLLQQ